jgi:thioredoxin-related protein
MRLLNLIVFLLVSYWGFGQNTALTAFYEGPIEDVLIEAKRSKRPVFLDFTSKNCAHCLKMQKEVFANATVANKLNVGFLAYKVDLDEPEGKILAQKYNVQEYPSFLVLAAQGSQIGSIKGFWTAAQFLKELNKITEPSTKPSQLQKKRRFFGLFGS